MNDDSAQLGIAVGRISVAINDGEIGGLIMIFDAPAIVVREAHDLANLIAIELVVGSEDATLPLDGHFLLFASGRCTARSFLLNRRCSQDSFRRRLSNER